MKYGLVFKKENSLYVSIYEDGELKEAEDLPDDRGVYKDYTDKEGSFVEISKMKFCQEAVLIRDLQKISIQNDEHPNLTFVDFIKADEGVKFVKSIFEGLVNATRTNAGSDSGNN